MVKKATMIKISLLLSLLGAFLLQFSQMTSICYYLIFPAATVLVLLSGERLTIIYKSKETGSGGILAAFFLYAFLFGILQGTSMGILYWLPYFYLALVLLSVRKEYFKSIADVIFPLLVVIGVIQALGVISQVFVHPIWDLIVSKYMSPSQISELLARESDGYYSGFSTEVAVSAFYIDFSVLICFFKIWQSKKWTNVNTLVVILGFYAIILTSKRAHLLFLIVSIIVVVIVSNPDYNAIRRWIKYILAVFVAICIIKYISTIADSESSIGRILLLFENLSGGEESLNDLSTGRIALWILAIKLFMSSPLFGIGWCNYYKHNILQYHAHNTYLQVLCETGIAGMALYTIFIVMTVTKAIGVIKKCLTCGRKDLLQIACPAFGMQCFYLLYSLTGNTLYDYWYFWAYSIAAAVIYYVGSQIDGTPRRFLEDCVK